MMEDRVLECRIYEDVDIEEESITVYVKLKDDSILPFPEILADPVFTPGFLFIDHNFFGKRMTSQVRESQIKYISHFRVPIKKVEK